MAFGTGRVHALPVDDGIDLRRWRSVDLGRFTMGIGDSRGSVAASATGLDRARAALSALAGATGASLFALKYSGIFVAIGAGVVFGIVCLRERYWQLILFAGLGFLTVIGAIIWAFHRGRPLPLLHTRR